MKARLAMLGAVVGGHHADVRRRGRPRRIEAAGLCRQRAGMRSRRPRPSCSGRPRTGRCAASPWSRARSTTPSTPSTVAASRTCSISTRVRVGRRASQDAAAATAAYRVLLAITPTTRHEGLGTAYQATLAAIPDGPSKQGGIRAGEAAAAAMIAARQNDGFMAPFTPDIGTDAGKWRPIGWPTTPAFDPDGWVGNLKPFLIKSAVGVPHEGPERAHERCLRKGLRRGERARCADELDADGRPDGCRRLLAVRSHRSLESACPGARCPLRARHGRPGSALRRR